MTGISVVQETIVDRDIATTFAAIVPIDLTQIFTGHIFLPAVVDVHDATGAWDAPDQTRRVLLSDNSEAHEHLQGYDAPNSFNYKVSGFTGSLRLLAKSAQGRWDFEAVSDQKTHIRWRYTFIPAGLFATPFIWLVGKILWRGYMKKALMLSKSIAEKA